MRRDEQLCPFQLGEHTVFRHCPVDTIVYMQSSRIKFFIRENLLPLTSSSCHAVSPPRRLTYHSCATSVSAVWSASSPASALVQASCFALYVRGFILKENVVHTLWWLWFKGFEGGGSRQQKKRYKPCFPHITANARLQANKRGELMGLLRQAGITPSVVSMKEGGCSVLFSVNNKWSSPGHIRIKELEFEFVALSDTGHWTICCWTLDTLSAKGNSACHCGDCLRPSLCWPSIIMQCDSHWQCQTCPRTYPFKLRVMGNTGQYYPECWEMDFFELVIWRSCWQYTRIWRLKSSRIGKYTGQNLSRSSTRTAWDKSGVARRPLKVPIRLSCCLSR